MGFLVQVQGLEGTSGPLQGRIFSINPTTHSIDIPHQEFRRSDLSGSGERVKMQSLVVFPF